MNSVNPAEWEHHKQESVSILKISGKYALVFNHRGYANALYSEDYG
jgi:hypothetical protein